MADADDVRVRTRAANLLPEEARVGSDDAQAQAEAVLAESHERAADREAAPGSRVEHRTSEEIADLK